MAEALSADVKSWIFIVLKQWKTYWIYRKKNKNKNYIYIFENINDLILIKKYYAWIINQLLLRLVNILCYIVQNLSLIKFIESDNVTNIMFECRHNLITYLTFALTFCIITSRTLQN